MEELERIKITSAEVKDRRLDELIVKEAPRRGPPPGASRAAPSAPLYYNPIFVYALAGGLAAFGVAGTLEQFIDERNHRTGALMGLFPLMGAGIGLAIAAADALLSRNVSRAASSGIVGLGVGFLAGAVGYFIANIIFTVFIAAAAGMSSRPIRDISDVRGISFFLLIVGRALAWSVVSIGMGLGQGLALKSKKLVLNGIVGGMIGGFLGGLTFDPLDKIFHGGPYDHAGLSRLIGCTTIGLSVGFFIGLVESMSKDAWLFMRAGPLAGKEFVIYKDPTVLGSAPKCDVYLFKDAAIEPQHAEIRAGGLRYEIVDLDTRQGTYVNGARVKSRVLQPGDTIVLGETVLEYAERERR